MIDLGSGIGIIRVLQMSKLSLTHVLGWLYMGLI
jgi:hypothetical protein